MSEAPTKFVAHTPDVEVSGAMLREVAQLAPGQVLKLFGEGEAPDFVVVLAADFEHVLSLAGLDLRRSR